MKLDKAFPETPKAFEDAILHGIRKGEKRMKMKHKLRLSAVAAALCACLVLVAFASGGGSKDDNTSVATNPEPTANIQGGTNTAKPIPSPTPGITGASESEPLPTLTPWNIPLTVYATEHGVYFHSISDCSGMLNAKTMTLDEATEANKVPCPVCIPEGSINIDLSKYEDYAQAQLEAFFPGCTEAFCRFYNVDSLWYDAGLDNAGHVKVDIYARTDVPIATADIVPGMSASAFYFTFDNVELPTRILACTQEGTISEQVYRLYRSSLNDVLSPVLDVVNAQPYGRYPINADVFSLSCLEIKSHEVMGCMSLSLQFENYNGCSASFIYDLIENPDGTLIHFTLERGEG